MLKCAMVNKKPHVDNTFNIIKKAYVVARASSGTTSFFITRLNVNLSEDLGDQE